VVEYETHGGYDAMSAAYVVRSMDPSTGYAVCELDTGVAPHAMDKTGEVVEERDAAFIAHARADVPVLLERIDALRAILAPLLDNPLLEDANAPGAVTCVVCRRYTNYAAEGDWRPRAPLHEDGCPVLRRDELLGRV